MNMNSMNNMTTDLFPSSSLLRSNPTPSPQEIIDSDNDNDNTFEEDEIEDDSNHQHNHQQNHPNLKDKKDLDELLAKELNSLTIHERNNVFETIHGVDQPTFIETPKLIQESIYKLQIELDKIPLNKKQAYIKALSLSSKNKNKNSKSSYCCYIKSRQFLLMFLRCDNFNTKLAAKRICLYFERIQKYFGSGNSGNSNDDDDVLIRKLHINDLSSEAIDYLKTGVRQILPNAKDSSGRTIFFDHYLLAEKMINISPIAMIQTYIYLFYSAIIDDEITQKRGIVFICYIVGNMINGFDSDTYSHISDIQYWLPIKIVAHHICFNSPIFHVWAPLAWIVMGKDMRKRVRMHDGTHLECMYALQSFGIPINKLPVDYNGNIKLTIHHQWIQYKQSQIIKFNEEELEYYEENENEIDAIDDAIDEEDDDDDKETKQQQQPSATTTSTTDNDNNNNNNTHTTPKSKQHNTKKRIIEKLELNDVALWRGRVYQRHPGNIQMRQLIENKYRIQYDKAPKGIKADIAMKIVNEIKHINGGRFLIKDSTRENYWIEVDDTIAQKKVSKAFRSARKQPSSTTSTTTTKIKTGKDGNKRLRVESSSSSLVVPPLPIRTTTQQRPSSLSLSSSSILSTTAATTFSMTSRNTHNNNYYHTTSSSTSSSIGRNNNNNNNNNSNRAALLFTGGGGNGGSGSSSDDDNNNISNNNPNCGCILFPGFTTSFSNNNNKFLN